MKGCFMLCLATMLMVLGSWKLVELVIAFLTYLHRWV